MKEAWAALEALRERGLKLQTIANLTWGRVHLDDKEPWIEIIQGSHPRRIVFLCGNHASALAAYRDALKPKSWDAYLFEESVCCP